MSAKTRLIFEGDNRTRRAFNSINTSFGQLQRRLGGLRAGVTAFGAALGAAGFARATAENIRFADSIAKTATKFQTTSEEISKLAFAADRSGIAFRTLDTGLRTLSVRTEEAQRGLKDQAAAFDRLRINADKFSQLPITDRLRVLAEQFKTISGTERIDLADNLFGGRGVAFLQLLEQGASGIEQLTREASEFGAVIGGQTAAAAESSVDSLTNLSSAFRSLTLAIASPERLNALTGVINSIARVLGRDVPEGTRAAAEGTRTLRSETEEAVTVVGRLGEEAEQSSRKLQDVLAEVLTAPKINPTVEIIPPEEELENQFQPIRSTLSNAILQGSQEGTEGARGVIGNWLANISADLAASAFLQILRQLLPGLEGGTGALGAIGGVLGFDRGGVVPGPRGSAQLAVVHGGETILPTHRGGSSGSTVLNIDARGADAGVEQRVRTAVAQGMAAVEARMYDARARGSF